MVDHFSLHTQNSNCWPQHHRGLFSFSTCLMRSIRFETSIPSESSRTLFPFLILSFTIDVLDRPSHLLPSTIFDHHLGSQDNFAAKIASWLMILHPTLRCIAKKRTFLRFSSEQFEPSSFVPNSSFRTLITTASFRHPTIHSWKLKICFSTVRFQVTFPSHGKSHPS